MQSNHSSRPSPAMVLASIALVFALAGTAIAGPDAISSAVTKSQVKKLAKKQGKKQGKKQAIKQIDKAEPNLDVNSAKTADNATNAENATNAQNATNAENAVNAENGAPRAFARVLNNTGGLGVDEARSKGITDADVTFVGGSVYCFELGFTPRQVQATIDWVAGDANTFSHASVQPYNQCPAGNDGSVRTTANNGAGIANINFYVSFDE